MKKIVSLILSVIMTISCFNMVYAGENDYIALGDSIARGYGLASADQAYPQIFAKNRQLNLTNLGVDGMTSQQLLDAVTGNDSLAEAEIITISIGSNDLLQPLIQILGEKLGVDTTTVEGDVYLALQTRINEIYADGAGKSKLENIFTSLIKALTNNATLNTAADNFANTTFPAIMTEIRKINPDAQIYITDIYNPYKNVTVNTKLSANSSAFVELGDLCQPYINRINKAFATPTDYTLISITEIFNSRVLTNATRSIWVEEIMSATFDPHPNYAGHYLVATLMSNAYIPEFVYGDANSDGSVEANDAAKILQYVLNSNSVEMTADELLKSDVTGDNEITAQDSATVLQKVLKADFQFAVAE